MKVRLEGWTAPQKMAENLLKQWQTTNSAELSVYRENKTGNERTFVRDLESRFKGTFERLGLASVGERVTDRANAIGTSVTDAISGNVPGLMNVFGTITQVWSNLPMSGRVTGTEATGSIANENGPPDGCTTSSADSDPLSPD